MDYKEKIDFCINCLSDEFNISEKQAELIIKELEIEEVVFERYDSEIKDFEESLQKTWEREIEMNSDLYSDDIHGGI